MAVLQEVLLDSCGQLDSCTFGGRDACLPCRLLLICIFLSQVLKILYPQPKSPLLESNG